MNVFPNNPANGSVFELRSGLFFKYDATIRSWIKLASFGMTVPVASPVSDGLMAAVDLKKLNRLVLPPPISTIIGNDCAFPFQAGNVNLYGDKFVGVDGTISVQNVDEYGDLISKSIPFHIHQHTYGFDFTLDLPELVAELKARKQFNVISRRGATGAKGSTGIDGVDYVLAGRPGQAGDDGTAPPCGLQLEVDDLLVEPHEGMTKALVGSRVVFDYDDPLKYKLVFDRQAIGQTDYAADKFHVQDDNSQWVLAVTGDQLDDQIDDPRSQAACAQPFGAGRSQKLYHIDMEPIVTAIHDRFVREAEIIKGSYENITKFWVQTMSDLFDEQKAALCCALEHCMSIKKNADVRAHMEDVAASAAGSANILLHGRDSNEAVTLSSTRTLKQVGGPDLCRGGPRFPQYPDLAASSSGVVAAKVQTVKSQMVGNDIEAAKVEEVSGAVVVIDPLINSSLATAVLVPLAANNYTAVITKYDIITNGKYYGSVNIKHSSQSIRFLDKGEFDNLIDARDAYEGLGLSFNHGGGTVAVWLTDVNPFNCSGSIEISISPVPVSRELVESQDCSMSAEHLVWYERGWQNGECCGLVVNVMGQDYIIMKRSIGDDLTCGGGESANEPCIAKFAHPAIAWPTFDGVSFVPIGSDTVGFHFDAKLSELVLDKITNGEGSNHKGNPANLRHLVYQFTTILFPTN